MGIINHISNDEKGKNDFGKTMEIDNASEQCETLKVTPEQLGALVTGTRALAIKTKSGELVFLEFNNKD